MKSGGVAPSPVTISDATALASTGLTPRQFRAFVRDRHVAHARLGRRLVVRVDAFLAAIDQLAGDATARRPATAWSEDDFVSRVAARARGGR